MMPFDVFDFDIFSRAGDARHPPRPGCPRHSLDATGKCTPPVFNVGNGEHLYVTFSPGPWTGKDWAELRGGLQCG